MNFLLFPVVGAWQHGSYHLNLLNFIVNLSVSMQTRTLLRFAFSLPLKDVDERYYHLSIAESKVQEMAFAITQNAPLFASIEPDYNRQFDILSICNEFT